MSTATLVPAEYVREKLQSGADTLLVCAYDDPAKCRKVRVDGAIDFATLEKQKESLARDREILFYCA
jgi:hypothetical protein